MCLYAVPDALAQGTCRFIIFSLKNKQKLLITIFFIVYCRAEGYSLTCLDPCWARGVAI